MKMIKNAIALGLGLVVMGSATFAQSLADAKKAIDAEQYQKATSMLKTLTASQSKPENFFSLGEVYLKTDDIDSAKAAFTKGVAADAKDALNYIGLGNVDLRTNNVAAAKANFDKAVSLASKDYKTYLYIGKAYIAQEKPDFAAAYPFLTKAEELNGKSKTPDAEVYIALGDYWNFQKKNSEALGPYLTAVSVNPALHRANVQIANMYTNAFNFVDAEAKVKEVIAADANYGPAYRQLSETQMQWASFEPKEAQRLKSAALESYRKYLDLTDKSFDSRLRYAQFLVYGGDWKTLEEVANGLAMNNPPANKTLLIARLRGYAAFENGNFPQALQFMNEVFEKGKAEPARIQPSDYVYLGKSLEKDNKDSLAVLALKKATELDSSNADALVDVAKRLAVARKYDQSVDVYKFMIKEYPKSKNLYLNHYWLGQYLYRDYYYKNQAKLNPSKDILVEADSANAFLNRTSPDFLEAYLARATVARLMEADPSNPVGLAKPHYEAYIAQANTQIAAKPEKAQEAGVIRGLVESYNYLGYLEIEKDKEKAKEYFTKVLAIDPENKSASDNMKFLSPPPPAAPKKAPIKK